MPLLTLTPDRFVEQTVAGAPLGFSKRLTLTSVWMSQSNTGVPKEEPRVALKNNWWKEIVK